MEENKEADTSEEEQEEENKEVEFEPFLYTPGSNPNHHAEPGSNRTSETSSL